MHGKLKEQVKIKNLVLESGTQVYIDLAQAQIFDILSPADDVIVTVAMKYFTIRTLVKKSQIRIAA
ncbi:MAG: hypothetical protein GY863_22610 [bacterium]|nr:hypothetical protein [bacterium]